MTYFINKLDNIYCKCCPLKIKYLSKKRIDKPWMTGEILALVKEKSTYFKLYKRGLITKAQNNLFKNELNSKIRRSKRNFYHNYFMKYKSDVKKYWKGIRSVVGGRKCRNDTIKEITIDNRTITDPKIIADAFNAYFSTVAQNLHAALPPTDSVPIISLIDPVVNSFFMFPVSEYECKNVISRLKNSSYGIHSISTRLLKLISHCISRPLTKLINLSFSEGVFPSVLKTATVTPIFKKGDPLDRSNYRPISVLPLISKVFEKCMSNRLSKFLYKYSILSDNQFGFQRGKSTSDAISCLTDYLYEGFNLKKHNIAVFLDLSKAYDTVDHNILLSMLHSYGIRGTTFRWFTSYLSDRSCRVRIDKSLSERSVLNVSIPHSRKDLY